MKNLKVVILAGGFGTRLMEETKIKPKPLVEIGSYPIIQHIINHYSYYGLKNFVICLGYKGRQIRKYFKKSKINKYNKIQLIDTGLNSLTGERLRRIKGFVGDQFFLTYGDGVSDINIKKTYEIFKKRKKIGLVTAINPEARYGILNIKKDIVINFAEKPDHDNIWINGGFFIFDKRIFNYLKGKNPILERKPLELLAKNKQLSSYKHRGFWKCMDTLRDKVDLNKIWKKNKHKWKK